jgi:hypothetical protein
MAGERDFYENAKGFMGKVFERIGSPEKALFDNKDGLFNVARAISFGYRMIKATDSASVAVECLDGMDYVYDNKCHAFILEEGIVLIKAHEMVNNKFDISEKLKKEYEDKIVNVYRRILYVFSNDFASEEITSLSDFRYKQLEKFGKLIKDLSVIKFDDNQILFETYDKNVKNWFGDNDDIKILGNKEFKMKLAVDWRRYSPSSDNVDQFLEHKGLNRQK